MNAFVARQPIFDRQEKVFAYELLYRQNMANYYYHPDGDNATKTLITNSFLLFGINELTSGKLAFINFTSNTIKKGLPTALPKETVAIEILETIEPDDEIIAACKVLKELGYKLVLDDYVFEPKHDSFIELADIIKVDYRLTSPNARKRLIKEIYGKWPKIKFLAEKIETKAEFNEAVKIGFELFQGYYFCKPIITSVKNIPHNKLKLLKLSNQIFDEHFSFEQIEKVISGDVSLIFKLLKYINSPFFGFNSKITSIRQALALLGIDELKKWMLLVSLQETAKDEPEELLTNSLLRAKLGENIASKTALKKESSNVFLMGLFSMLDVLLDKPMLEVLEELPVTENVKEALIGRHNSYREILDLIIAYEQANWDLVSKYCSLLALNEKELTKMYFDAIAFTQDVAQTLR